MAQPAPGRLVTPKYFSTLRIPVLRGRSFMDQDTASAQRVAIVSESTARRYWAGEDPVGKGIRTQRSGIDSPPMIVVGVANDVDEPTPSRKEIQETIYVPFAQGTSNDGTWATSSIQFAVRTTGEPLNTVASVQRAVWQVDQRLPIFDIATADRLYNDALSQTRAGAGTILCFSVFGLLLAALGTYGVFSYSVGCRTREIGIRTALGAVPGDVLWLVMRRGASLALVGVALGTAGVFALTKIMASILSQIRPGDPVTLAFAASLLISVALLACYIPARRAASVDPTEALRCE